MDNLSQYTYIKSEKDRKLYELIKSKKDYFELSTKDIRTDIMEEVWKLYAQHVDESKNPFSSKKRLPLAMRAVDTLTAFLVAKDPTFNVIPVGDGDEIKAELQKELLQYQAKQKNMLNLKRNAKTLVKCGSLFGIAFWFVDWKTLLSDDPDEEGNREVLFDGPVLETLNPMDVFYDPFVGETIYQTMFIKRLILPLEIIRENKAYKIPSNFKPSYKSGESKGYDSSRLDQYDLNTGNETDENQDKVELWECWTKKEVVTILDPEGDPCIIRKMKNRHGFIPVVKFDYETSPLPNRYVGHGAIGPNIKVNKGIDEALNHTIDNVRIILNSMWKVKKDKRVDARQFLAKPGGLIQLDDLGDAEPVRPADTTGAGYQLINLLKGEWASGTSVTAIRQGVGGEANTAAEANIAQDNADITTNAVKQNFEDALAELGRMVAKMNVRNLQGTQSIRIFNIDLINRLNKGMTQESLGPEQLKEIAERGTLYGFLLNEQDKQAALATGQLPGLEISEEKRQKIKKYGQLIRFSADLVDVDTDIEVVADSTMNKNTDVMMKLVQNHVMILQKLGAKLNTTEISKVMADLSGVPGVEKFVEVEPPPMPPTQNKPMGNQGMPMPQPMPLPTPDQLNSPVELQKSVQRIWPKN